MRAFKIEKLIESGLLLINDGYRAKNVELSTVGIPFARAGNINNGFHFEDADCFPIENLDKVGFKISQPGDVVFTSKGTVGRFAFVRPTTQRFVYAPQLCFWRSIDHRQIDPLWLYYWIQGREFLLQYKGVAGQTDMAEYVSLRDQRRMQITIPSLYEQRAIAHILGALDDKIELNRRMNETLEAMAHTIFKSWFVDFDPVRAKQEGKKPVGMDDDTAALFPDSLVESELGGIPEGWEVGTVGNIADNPKRSIKPQEIDSNIPYIGLEHMPRMNIALSEWGEAGKVTSNKYRFKSGEILFGKLRPYFHKVGVAPLDGVSSTDILVIIPSVSCWFGYLLFTVSSVDFVAYTDASSTGTKMPRTNWKDMARYQIPLPDNMKITECFNRFAETTVQKIIANIYQSQTLATLRDTLLPKLLSGELRIKDAEKFAEKAL